MMWVPTHDLSVFVFVAHALIEFYFFDYEKQEYGLRDIGVYIK